MAEKAKTVKTKYRILVSVNGHEWDLKPEVIEASSRESAIRAWRENNSPQVPEAMFAAIPAGSWDPIRPRTFTREVTKFESVNPDQLKVTESEDLK